jgi:hypothetical protein
VSFSAAQIFASVMRPFRCSAVSDLHRNSLDRPDIVGEIARPLELIEKRLPACFGLAALTQDSVRTERERARQHRNLGSWGSLQVVQPVSSIDRLEAEFTSPNRFLASSAAEAVLTTASRGPGAANIVRLKSVSVAAGFRWATAKNSAYTMLNCETRAAPCSPHSGESSAGTQSAKSDSFVSIEVERLVMAMTFAVLVR